jgi:hypothetical protein
MTRRIDILKRKTINSLKDSDIDEILGRLQKEAKPRVDTIHKKAAAGKLTGTDAWYQASYAVFSKRNNRSLDDFVCVTAFAYSWVSKIPTCGTTRKQFAEFSKAVKQVEAAKSKQERSAAQATLFKVTQSATGMRNKDSMVVVSKVLHFWDPTLAPMVDKWSRNALRRLGVVATRSYTEYWEFLDRLISRLADSRTGSRHLDYRKLDEYLFQLGKSTSSKSESPISRKARVAPRSPAQRSIRKPPAQRKVDLARTIYAEMKGQSSAAVINAFVERAGLTQKGARTYYYNLRNRVGNVKER